MGVGNELEFFYHKRRNRRQRDTHKNGDEESHDERVDNHMKRQRDQTCD